MRPKHVGDDGGAGGDEDLGGNKLTLIMMTVAKSGATPASREGAPLPGKAASEYRYLKTRALTLATAWQHHPVYLFLN